MIIPVEIEAHKEDVKTAEKRLINLDMVVMIDLEYRRVHLTEGYRFLTLTEEGLQRLRLKIHKLNERERIYYEKITNK